MDTAILEEIGLTKSEIKVYLALLKLGSSTKKDIVKESRITPSKLYEITDKLIEKGMVSYVKKNKVLHFSASPPEQVLDFLEIKKQKLEEQERDFGKLIPELKSLERIPETDVEVFRGWKGMRTVYNMILDTLEKGEVDYVLGASPGENMEKVGNFFKKYHKERRAKGIHLKILMDSRVKKWTLDILNNKKYDHVRFMEQTAPSEINFYKDRVMILVLSKIPVVVLIKNQFVADSYMNYFNHFWKISKR